MSSNEHDWAQHRKTYSHKTFDDVEIVFCSKRKLNKNKQTKILVDMS